MDKKFLKRNKWDKLDVPTLNKVIEITNVMASMLTISTKLNGNEGSYSPTRVEARIDELKMLAEYFKTIADTLTGDNNKK